MATTDVQVRLATEADLPAIRAIYNHYVTTSTCTFQVEPDSEEDRRNWFLNRGPSHPVVVAEAGWEVVGWGALSAWKSRCAYARSVEASVYVQPDWQRRGIGRAILLDLIDRARAAGHHTIIGGACTEHSGSLALQRGLGFESIGCFREVGWKFGKWLDVHYMQRIL